MMVNKPLILPRRLCRYITQLYLLNNIIYMEDRCLTMWPDLLSYLSSTIRG